MSRLSVALAALSAMGAAQVGPVLADEAAEVAAAEYRQAMSLTPNVENGRQIYLTCAVCHRPEGWGTIDGAYPQIAGQLRSVIVKQLTDIRAHMRDVPPMYPFSVPRILGGPQNIADVAAYVADLPMAPRNGVGVGADLERGRQVYASHCAECHGERGEGDAEKLVPAMAGQHYPYLMRQMDAIRAGQRWHLGPETVDPIGRLGAREQAAVIDYASRLRPPSAKLAADGWMNPDFPGPVREASGLPPLSVAPLPRVQGEGGDGQRP